MGKPKRVEDAIAQLPEDDYIEQQIEAPRDLRKRLRASLGDEEGRELIDAGKAIKVYVEDLAAVGVQVPEDIIETARTSVVPYVPSFRVDEQGHVFTNAPQPLARHGSTLDRLPDFKKPSRRCR